MESERGEAFGGEGFGAGDGTGEWGAAEVTFSGPREVVVPDVTKGMVETDALEAVVEADGPAVLASEGGEDDLREVLEAVDLWIVGWGHGKLRREGVQGIRREE